MSRPTSIADEPSGIHRSVISATWANTAKWPPARYRTQADLWVLILRRRIRFLGVADDPLGAGRRFVERRSWPLRWTFVATAVPSGLAFGLSFCGRIGSIRLSHTDPAAR